MSKPKPHGRYKKPCPDLPKGVTCPLCGSGYICLQPERKAIPATTKGDTIDARGELQS